MRKAEIRIHDKTAGWLIQDENGYLFVYDTGYLGMPDAEPVSLTLPLKKAPYTSKVLFSFFDGLIPEGWLLEIAEKSWKMKLIFMLPAVKRSLASQFLRNYPLPKPKWKNLLCRWCAAISPSPAFNQKFHWNLHQDQTGKNQNDLQL
jgi:serine/threonine-protein kinase HipA